MPIAEAPTEEQGTGMRGALRRVAVSMGFGAFAAAFLVAVREASFEEGLFPRAAAVLLLVLVLPMAVVTDLRRARGGEQADDVPHPGPTRLLVIAVATTFVYVAVMPVLGFGVTTFLFVTVTIWLLGRRLVLSAPSGLAVALVSTALFRGVFGLRLPRLPFPW